MRISPFSRRPVDGIPVPGISLFDIPWQSTDSLANVCDLGGDASISPDINDLRRRHSSRRDESPSITIPCAGPRMPRHGKVWKRGEEAVFPC